MSTRDIEAHLRELDGVSVGRDLILRVTDAVKDDARARQARALDDVCPAVFPDAFLLKIREGGSPRARSQVLGAGPTAQRCSNGGELVSAVSGEVGVSEVLARQPVGLLAGPALPGTCGSQKYTCRPVSIRSRVWRAIQGPAPCQCDRRSCSGSVVIDTSPCG